MATLRALETPEPLERFVEITRIIRQLEAERDALKDTILEALQHEPPANDGTQSVDFDGFRLEVASRRSYVYSDDVKKLEQHVKEMKTAERLSGRAEVASMGLHVRCTAHRSTSEVEARERKATAIATYLASGGFTAAAVSSWVQTERDAVARRAGQRTPSEKTWALVISKVSEMSVAA